MVGVMGQDDSRNHNYMITKQYLLGVHHQDHHPCHALLNVKQPPRHIKKSMHNVNELDVFNYVSQYEELSHSSIKSCKTAIHTDMVKDSRRRYEHNKVIGLHPLLIHDLEQKLPRSTRAMLSQLRSGCYTMLNSYMSRIDNTIANNCADWNGMPHNTRHLFSYPARPTNLTVDDL